MKINPRAISVAVVLAGAATGLGVTAASAVTPVSIPVTATTMISNRPDGGTHDNPIAGVNKTWANDNFKRVATIVRGAQVPVSNCPHSGTGKCWSWTGTITDTGTFTTNPTATSGAMSPQAGKVLDTAVAGSFAGGSTTIKFFSSWKTANASFVPKTMNNHGMLPTGRATTTNWVEQFFGGSAVFNSAANPGGPDLGAWGWTYTLNFGSNHACVNDAYRWVDSAANGGGSKNTDGDILAPNAADCT
jgi:ribosomal protein S8E